MVRGGHLQKAGEEQGVLGHTLHWYLEREEKKHSMVVSRIVYVVCLNENKKDEQNSREIVGSAARWFLLEPNWFLLEGRGSKNLGLVPGSFLVPFCIREYFEYLCSKTLKKSLIFLKNLGPFLIFRGIFRLGSFWFLFEAHLVPFHLKHLAALIVGMLKRDDKNSIEFLGQNGYRLLAAFLGSGSL